MSHQSTPDLRTLHAVRVLGYADTDVVADRAGVAVDEADWILRKAQKQGWVQRTAFAGDGGWSLTEEGKSANEDQLATERRQTDAGAVVGAAYREFLPLNGRLVKAVTDWQMRPTDADRFAVNDHRDGEWDGRVLDELAAISADARPIVGAVARVLARFDGYLDRYDAALLRARSGGHDWIDKTDRDSCHKVWFQLHEDLIATLGIDRHTGGA
ncbi:hypothetical protein [Gordonia sp. (in: high G+C Gram-positive bacteria)]|uniref:hypothetical protein n=1 Tax=Gordonia sp. (in: high G+C Gram-positive bacteria) TaxID=84139 RepID=UPI0039E46C1B